MKAITETNFNFPGQIDVYHGKVRDVYTLENGIILMISTDRLSAFDVVMPQGIPYKGQVLNQIASRSLDATSDIIDNWKFSTPDPNVTAGRICEPFKVEMVIRAYLAGHAWRLYKEGKRLICGVPMPDGLKENDPLPYPIITPTTKASVGHDQDISREEILKQELLTPEEYTQLEQYTISLFRRGTEMARERGLILVDTKYEFGKAQGKIYLIDEVHTPDSSRYFYSEGYEQRQQKGEPQKQLSKEFVREWLLSQGFNGGENQQVPTMSKEFVKQVSDRYIELYQNITGEDFEKPSGEDILNRIEQNCLNFLQSQQVAR
jgi:phosphoribosylaminoimidazole-succinocarboxamide synthase